ncbi:MAG: aminotransferase class I/II-fold pyridoxal phosphate-dependent enzyme [Planctomycetota bacterium]
MRDLAAHLSERALGVDASGIRKVFDLAAKLKDPINLSIGLPDFDVPDEAKDVAIQAIRDGHNRYTPTQGIAPLRERLASDHACDVDNVLVTSGVSGGLFLSILATVNPGDEVVFLDPYFVMYRHLVTIAGGKSVPVDSYPDFRFDAAKVEAAITPRTKLLILNSPSNPTGVMMTEAEVRAAAELAKKHDLLVVSDEIYVPFLYGEATTVPSIADLWPKTILLRGFSKTYGMTGWRLGYAIAPREVAEQMIKLQQYTFVCAPSPFQHAALAALDIPVDDHITAYRRKRDIVMSELGETFEIEHPDGAFYAFPKVPESQTAMQFAERMIEKNVLVIPGSVFSAKDTHFRLSFGLPDERLIVGCKRLRDAAS